MNKNYISKLLLSLSILSSFNITYTALNEGYKVKASESQFYIRPEKVSIDDAKKLLVDGNKRYVDNKPLAIDISDTRRKNLSSNGQKPFAVILSCSDSRVPPELVFNQGLGDLFVIRNAGNVVDPIALGSIEYGTEHLNAPLIVVLGHEKCGAVEATIKGGETSENITSILNKIKPSYNKVKNQSQNIDEVINLTVNENINNSVSVISKSPVIKKLLDEKKVDIIGAKYKMDTGEVTYDFSK
ncbi:carbonic anhydrase [Clostridium sp. 'White wine YQ']|uniref:carbonic anhydrase n=1 Tax=Clostridium sp. 'White wine YQ' TaxID=3027474 RepID=UPI0023651F53|nr:carbonic anhydrase [Clostridium sp. 'White wine YQ']MDD7793384.1 carbonic anhydrase [Clostridium sp. 'White wine YQ']